LSPFLIFSIVQSADPQVPCKDFCDDIGGECHSEFSSCRCHLGWYGHGCASSVMKEMPGAWYAFRSLIMIFYGVFFLFGVLLVFVGWREKVQRGFASGRLTLFHARNLSLISVLFLCLNILLFYGIDPEGFEKTSLPVGVNLFLNSVTFPLLATILMTILFHWAEVYYFSVKLLRQEEMLEKINVKYKSNLSLEDVLAKIRFINRLKVPFLVINLSCWALSLLTFIWNGLNLKGNQSIVYVWAVFLSIIFFGEAIGFFIFGRRLMNVMPEDVRGKMTKVTRLVSIETGVFCFVWIFTFIGASTHPNPTLYLVIFVIARAAMLAVIGMIYSGFLKFSRKFPFCHLKEQTESENTASGGAMSTGSEPLSTGVVASDGEKSDGEYGQPGSTTQTVEINTIARKKSDEESRDEASQDESGSDKEKAVELGSSSSSEES